MAVNEYQPDETKKVYLIKERVQQIEMMPGGQLRIVMADQEKGTMEELDMTFPSEEAAEAWIYQNFPELFD